MEINKWTQIGSLPSWYSIISIPWTSLNRPLSPSKSYRSKTGLSSFSRFFAKAVLTTELTRLARPTGMFPKLFSQNKHTEVRSSCRIHLLSLFHREFTNDCRTRWPLGTTIIYSMVCKYYLSNWMISSVGNSAFTMTNNLRARFSSLLSDAIRRFLLCGTVQVKNLFTEDSKAMEGLFKRPFPTNKYSAGFDALK